MAEFLHHTSCPHCGSSDANAVYDDGSTYCFSCTRSTNGGHKHSNKGKKVSEKVYYNGEFEALPNRHIDKTTAKTFGVKVDSKGNYIYPYYNSAGEVIATKIRVGGEKEFRVTGDLSSAQLFGMNVFGTGKKYLTIVEGQDDALAAYKMSGGFPVISVNSASSAAKDVKRHLDFIESFEKVKIAFDNDDAGKKASQEVAEIISPNKVEIISFTKYKDANDYLKAKDTQGYMADFWNSKKYSPVGIVTFADAFDAVKERKETQILPLPKSMPKLSSMLNGGIAKGEITVIGALTSIGKTTFVNNMLYGILSETDSKVGYLGLETTVGELASGLIDLHSKERVSEYDTLDKAKSSFDGISWKDNLIIIDHQGSLELEDMIKKMRNTIVAYDLDVFFLDPLQAALPDLNNDTVKYAMDAFLKLAKQTDVSLVLVSHMRKPSADKPHDVSEYDLLGSSSINQIAFNTILLSRDKMGETDDVKNSVMIRLVKARRTGRTGEAGWLIYNRDTGRLEESDNPYLEFGE